MDSTYIDIINVVLGLFFLFLGGDLIVRGSVLLARKLGLSSLLIGLTVVGFATSSPELIVSLSAALNGNADIAVGNVVGSNIANMLLILGVSAAIYPVVLQQGQVLRDSLFGVIAAGVITALSVYGVITQEIGLALFGSLLLYLFYCYYTDKRKNTPVEEEASSVKKEAINRAIFYCVASIALLYVGAQLLVSGAVAIAQELKVPPSVIGLTMVALGTSLPELATVIVAAFRKQSDLAIGNILGSNLFNLLGILGLTATVTPLTFDGRIAQMDIWIMLGLAALLLVLAKVLYKLGRLVGMLLLFAYIAYVVLAYAA